jgi:uncharacterized coiled-coil protein SlyX
MIKNISPAYIPADIFSNFAYLECVRRQPASLCYAFIMRRFIVSLLYISVMAVLASCGDGGAARGVLSRADSLMEEHTDSAMALLRRDSVMLVHAPKPQRMAYILSKTEAEDKLYITHSSDSAMQLAVKYFDRHGTALQRTRAWYLLGRVYCDMLLYGNALTAFDAAIAVQPDDDSTVCRYKARACSWAGSVYEEKNLHKDALRYNKMAYDYACKADISTVLVYSLRDIGRSYWAMDKTNEAIPYYLHAAGKADSLNNGYLYNMVMEELASIYIESRLVRNAYDALYTPFNGNTDEDLASHYFIWADYYRLKGMSDSAIIYNKKGMTYGLKLKNEDASLDVARLYVKTENKDEAIRYYEMYSAYVDSVDHDETVQYDNILSRMEQMFNVERQNVILAGQKLHLIVSLSVLIIVVLIAVFLVIRYFNRRKAVYKEQQVRIDQYWRSQRDRDLQKMEANEKRMAELEKELSASKDTLTEIRKKLMENEAEMLHRQNEQMLFERKHHELLVADLAETEVYKLFHDASACPTSSDYHKLSEALNKAYDGFTFRLKDLYPNISDLDLWICCMVKAGLTAKEICNISAYSFSSLSMAKSRLYAKMLNKKGSAKAFDAFISGF